jgi:hypothetical protein
MNYTMSGNGKINHSSKDLASELSRDPSGSTPRQNEHWNDKKSATIEYYVTLRRSAKDNAASAALQSVYHPSIS